MYGEKTLNPPFVRLSQGDIRNGYTIRILNKTRRARSVELGANGIANGRLASMGRQTESSGRVLIQAAPDTVTTVRVTLSAAPGDSAGPRNFHFTLTDQDTGETARKQSVFVFGAAP